MSGNTFFEVKFTAHDPMQVQTDENGVCAFSIDDAEYTLQDAGDTVRVWMSTGGLVPKSGGDVNGAAYIVSVSPTIESDKHASQTQEKISVGMSREGVMRRCIICRGRRYCITRGCANTPCGWICDR